MVSSNSWSQLFSLKSINGVLKPFQKSLLLPKTAYPKEQDKTVDVFGEETLGCDRDASGLIRPVEGGNCHLQKKMYAADDTDGAGDDYVTYVTVAGSPIRPVGRELAITKWQRAPTTKWQRLPTARCPDYRTAIYYLQSVQGNVV